MTILASYSVKSENLFLTFHAPTEVTKNVIAPSTWRKNPKSEARNSKQTGAKINSKPGKSKTKNPNRVCLEHCICFWSFVFVSDFGFRASNFKSLWLDLDMQQPARILFSEALHMLGIGLQRDRLERFVKRPQAAAIVGTEDDVVLAHLGDQKR